MSFKIRAERFVGLFWVGSFLSTYWSGNSSVWVLILLCKLRILSSIKGHYREEKEQREKQRPLLGSGSQSSIGIS